MEFLPTKLVLDFFSEWFGIEDDCDDCIDNYHAESTRLLADSVTTDDDVLSTSSLSKLGSQNLIRNLGIMFVIAAAILLILVLLRLLRCVVHRYPMVHKLYSKIHNKMFYNLFIRYIL